MRGWIKNAGNDFLVNEDDYVLGAVIRDADGFFRPFAYRAGPSGCEDVPLGRYVSEKAAREEVERDLSFYANT